jgi:hypothetical protein
MTDFENHRADELATPHHPAEVGLCRGQCVIKGWFFAASEKRLSSWDKEARNGLAV